MQCVILAAGAGKRMHPLTITRPKPLVEVAGKPLLDHIVSALPKVIDELIFVVGYRQEDLRAHIGDNFYGRPVRYAVQKEPLGTAYALLCAKDLLKGRFLVMLADDLHDAPSLARLVKHGMAVSVAESEHPERFGVVTLNENGTVREMIEKPSVPASNLVSTGVLVLDEHIFDYTAEPAANGERFLSNMVAQLARDYPVVAERQDFWLPIGYPEDIAHAEACLRRHAARRVGVAEKA
jgi:NDP-sugar pyrophosphorylase family protein